VRWPWSKREPPLTIPPYQVPVSKRETQKEPSIIVEEHDSSDVDIQELQSRTGMQRVFDRITGKFKD
jgi:hypothetical protein